MSKFCDASQKKNHKTPTKIDRTVEIFANYMYQIMGNYLVKSFFIILSKSMVKYVIHSCIILEIRDERHIPSHIPIKHHYKYFMIDKFIQMQCRNCKIMWLIMMDKDTVLVLVI